MGRAENTLRDCPATPPELLERIKAAVEPVEKVEWPKRLDAARKDDGNKPRYDLMPFDALDEVGRVFAFGATKYAAHNWCKGMAWGRLIAAACRHVGAFARGENNDPESGLSHLAHAACCVLMLLAYTKRGAGTDDRYRAP